MNEWVLVEMGVVGCIELLHDLDIANCKEGLVAGEQDRSFVKCYAVGVFDPLGNRLFVFPVIEAR